MFVFDEVNDYDDHLCGKNGGHGGYGNDIKDFIHHYFKTNGESSGDLLFSIIETTSLSNLTNIGETFLFGEFTDKGAIEILENYEEVIIAMKEEFKVSPAEFEDWYNRDATFIYRGQNKSDKKFRNLHWHTADGHLGKSKPINFYPSGEREELDFPNYLSVYAEKLFGKLGLADYPHYCIILKPLSLRSTQTAKTTYQPLGNFYLLFGTKTEKSEKFYLDLINFLVLVYINSKWEPLFNELKTLEKTIEDDIYPQFKKSGVADTYKTTKINNSNGYTLEKMYYNYFKPAGVKQTITDRYEKVIQQSFDYFLSEEYQNFKKQNNGDKSFPGNLNALIANGGKRALKEDGWKEDFAGILSSRIFVMVAMHVFDINISVVNNYIKQGCASNDFIDNKTVYNYWHDQRWLSPGSQNKLCDPDQQINYGKKMLGNMSKHELTSLHTFITLQKGKLSDKSEYREKCDKFLNEITKNLADL